MLTGRLAYVAGIGSTHATSILCQPFVPKGLMDIHPRTNASMWESDQPNWLCISSHSHLIAGQDRAHKRPLMADLLFGCPSIALGDLFQSSSTFLSLNLGDGCIH